MAEETAVASQVILDKSRKAQSPTVIKTKTRLPKPKQINYTGKFAIEFFKWWSDFKEDQYGACECKVYRKWPVIDLVLVGDKYKDRIDVIEGKMPFDEPEEFKSWFLHRYGSGQYKLVMDEKGIPGIVCSASIELDDNTIPPRVDPKALVIGHPDNNGYINGLRSRGVKLGDDATDEEEGDAMKVATNQLVDVLVHTNERQAEKLDDLSDKVIELRQEASAPANTAVSESIKLVADSARNVQQATLEAVKGFAAASAPNFNPIEMMRTAVELTKNDNGASMFNQMVELMKANMESQRMAHQQTLDLVKNLNEKKEEKSELSTLRENISTMKEMMEMFGFSRAGQVANVPPPTKSIFATFLESPEVVQTFGGVVTAGLRTMEAYFNSRGGAPPPAATSTNSVGPALVPKVNEPPQETPEQKLAKEQQQRFLQAIEPHIVSHFFDQSQQGLNGYTFALAIHQGLQAKFNPHSPVTDEGRQAYLTIRDGWKQEGFAKVIENYQPVAQFVLGNKPKWQQFLGEIMNFDQWVQAQGQEAKSPVA